MSQDFSIRRVTAPDIRNRKGGDAPIVALTAYHAHTARIIDPYVDMLLVGDSLGMVMSGLAHAGPRHRHRGPLPRGRGHPARRRRRPLQRLPERLTCPP